MTWYAYYGSFLLFFVLYVYIAFFISVQRTLICTMISQWYFTKTRMWLSGTLCKGYRVVFRHLGSIFYHGFIIAFLWPFRKIGQLFKNYINKIEYANGCQMCIIKCLKCLIMAYDKKFKYQYSQALYQVTNF